MMNIKVALGSATVLACALVGCGSDDDGSSSADAETVIVANGNADNGSAGRMTDALRLAGFSTGEAVNSQDKVADSIVYYSDANGSRMSLSRLLLRSVASTSSRCQTRHPRIQAASMVAACYCSSVRTKPIRRWKN